MTAPSPRDLLDPLPLPAVWRDADGELTPNAAWQDRFGPLPPALVVGPAHRDAVEAALASPEAAHLPATLADGTGAVTLAVGAPDAAGGRLVALAAVPSPDAQRLAELEHLVDALLHRVDVALYIKGLDGRYRWINDGGARMVGLTPAQVVGRDDVTLFGPEAAAEIAGLDGVVMATEQAMTYQPTRRIGGGSRTFFTSKYPYYDPNGRLAGIIGVSHEVSAWLRTRDAAEQQDRLAAVGRVAAGLAHQVNNPLMLVLEHLAQARAAMPDARAPEHGHVRAAEEAAQRVDTIVQEVLATTPGRAAAPGACSPARVARRAMGLALGADRGPAAVSLVVDSEREARCDEERLLAVLVQLVEHALARTPADAPEAAVRMRVAEDGQRLVIDIEDDGPVPARVELDRLFEPYTSAPGEGRLLGLWMAWRTATAMGASLERAETERAGSGCRLRLALPADPAPQAPDPHRPPTLLLVEDELALLGLLAEALSVDCDIHTATTGQEALDWLSAHPLPDLILCDLMMPDMTGIQLHAHLEGLGSPAARRMVFMTGGAFTEEARAFVARHEGRVLRKPFRLSALRESVQQWVAEGRERPLD